MAISAKDVMALREITGTGMMDCKKALIEADGDMDKAFCCCKEGWQNRRRRHSRQLCFGRR